VIYKNITFCVRQVPQLYKKLKWIDRDRPEVMLRHHVAYTLHQDEHA
jgi:hypothetical protein